MLALGEKRGRKNPRSQALFHGPPTLKITNLPVLSTMTNNKYCLTCAAGGVWGAPSQYQRQRRFYCFNFSFIIVSVFLFY